MLFGKSSAGTRDISRKRTPWLYPRSQFGRPVSKDRVSRNDVTGIRIDRHCAVGSARRHHSCSRRNICRGTVGFAGYRRIAQLAPSAFAKASAGQPSLASGETWEWLAQPELAKQAKAGWGARSLNAGRANPLIRHIVVAAQALMCHHRVPSACTISRARTWPIRDTSSSGDRAGTSAWRYLVIYARSMAAAGFSSP